MENNIKIKVKNLTVKYNSIIALDNINFNIYKNKILAIIGPAKSGKTTFLRCLNLLYKLNPEIKVSGEILFNNVNILSDNTEVYEIRRKIGMVFALPVPLPGTIYNNLAFGPRLKGIKNKKELDKIIQQSLKASFLWDEVKDRLNEPIFNLSGGQQQRLCLARVLVLQSEVLLLDEPCSGLDPVSTAKIEEALQELKKEHTIILVTNNVKQAARVSDLSAFFYLGKLIEYDKTSEIFANPKNKQTENYIMGKFG